MKQRLLTTASIKLGKICDKHMHLDRDFGLTLLPRDGRLLKQAAPVMRRRRVQDALLKD